MPIWINFTREKDDSKEIIVILDIRKATFKERFQTIYNLCFKGRASVKVSDTKMIKSIEHWDKKNENLDSK